RLPDAADLRGLQALSGRFHADSHEQQPVRPALARRHLPRPAQRRAREPRRLQLDPGGAGAMRRIVLIVTGLIAIGLLIALPAIGSNGDSGTYLVRGIFDNGSFVVSGEQVRIAGATVGTVQSVDVTGPDETASLEGGPHAVPGKAVVVMEIDDSGFK